VRGSVEAADDRKGARSRKQHIRARVEVERRRGSAAILVVEACLIVGVGVSDVVGRCRVRTALRDVDAALQHVGARVKIQCVLTERATVHGEDAVGGVTFLLGRAEVVDGVRIHAAEDFVLARRLYLVVGCRRIKALAC